MGSCVSKGAALGHRRPSCGDCEMGDDVEGLFAPGGMSGMRWGRCLLVLRESPRGAHEDE